MELTLDQALQKGIEAHKAGKVQEADRYYTAILKTNPKHPDANHNMGVLAVGVDKVREALPFFKTALEANAGIAQYWLSYINALIKLNRIDDARAILDQAKSHDVKGDDFEQIEKRLQVIASKLNLQYSIEEDFSLIGGGSMPDVKIASPVISIDSSISGNMLNKLSSLDVPIIPRVKDNKVIFDIRSSFQDDDEKIIDALNNL